MRSNLRRVWYQTSPYADWHEAYIEERHRGIVPGVDTGVSLSGHPGVRGDPARPDVSTRPSGKRRYHRVR